MTEALLEKRITIPTEYKHKCTNCMACYNVCPVGAIEMIEDKDGFVYPSIVEEKCTHCGLCTKKCPALNLEQTKEISKRLEKPAAYGGYIKDEEVRKNSSSGGVFSILSKYVLNKGGYVCGARFTKGGICEHVIVDNWEDLAPLRGSKYVQSNINNCYKEIKSLLEQDKYVLFTGTPCQVAGLYAVLGKDYEKLITVDLLCHGVPSQKVFREYLNELTGGLEEEVQNFKFRDKKDGWWKPSISFLLRGHYYYYYWEEAYIQGFLNNLILRQSCTDCKYSKTPRNGDFTIGDFWGVENNYIELHDNGGTSAILVNSIKAKTIMENIKHSFSKLKEVPIQEIAKNNVINTKSSIHPHAAFFREQYSKGEYTTITKLIRDCINKKDGIAILNYAEGTCNYGSCLVGYALQQKLKKYGYNSVNIRLYDNEKNCDLNNFRDFQGRYINFTAPAAGSLKKFNQNFQTFIVGGDCVFLNYGDDASANLFRLDWVNFSKNIASYAASFNFSTLKRCRKGKSGWHNYTEPEIKKFKRQLKRFSHVAVRENTGVKICKDNFDIKATQVMDSVFLLSPDEWRELAQTDKTKSYNGKKVSYTLCWKYLPEGIYEYINQIDNLEQLYSGDDYSMAVWGKNFKASGPTIENWVKAISECDMLYTDSFHGTCFAIIFNKPFITFFKEDTYNRVKSVLETLGLPDRNALTLDDVKRLENEPIDYTKANERLKEMLKISEDYLESVLKSHEHPDPVRGYMESLELLVEEKLPQKTIAAAPASIPAPSYPNKQKWYFLGIHVFKIAMKKGEKWFYLFGIPLVKETIKGSNTYYKLFGCIRILKKAVRK